MISTNNFSPKTLGFVTLLILLIGSTLRLTVYFQNRSLIIDEANLARNIVEKDYADFFQTLDYEQYAPPLFSVLTKGFTQLFGVNEFALRLPALVAGILSLFLLLLIAKRLNANYPARWYILLLFSFSTIAIRYSSELKQYGPDTAITLLFILWALKCRDKKFNLSLTLQWAILGAVAVWFSMPIIFVLASAGLAFLYNNWKLKIGNLPRLLLIGGIWTISFGVYFFAVLYNDSLTEGLQHHHGRYFFKLMPTNLESLTQSFNLIISMFRNVTDQTIISICWSIATFLVGSIVLARKKKFAFILLLMPIILCMIASHLHLYSFIARLVLFIFPLIMLAMGFGISFLWKRSNLALKLLFVGMILLTVVNKKGYQYLWTKLEYEDSKAVLEHLQKNNPNDEFIYVQSDGVPAFIFYNQMHDKAYHFSNYYLAHWREKPAAVIPKKMPPSETGEFWLFLSHTFPQENVEKQIASTNKIGTEISRFTSVQASAYHFIRE